jgi:hypothetical protein
LSWPLACVCGCCLFPASYACLAYRPCTQARLVSMRAEAALTVAQPPTCWLWLARELPKLAFAGSYQLQRSSPRQPNQSSAAGPGFTPFTRQTQQVLISAMKEVIIPKQGPAQLLAYRYACSARVWAYLHRRACKHHTQRCIRMLQPAYMVCTLRTLHESGHKGRPACPRVSCAGVGWALQPSMPRGTGRSVCGH